MKLDKMVTLAYNTNWTKINNFTIQLTPSQSKTNNQGILSKISNDQLNLALISCDIPPLNVSPIETFLGGRWYFTNGRADMARVTLTFRDFNEFALYKEFSKMFENSLGNYNNIHSTILDVFTDNEKGEKKIFSLSGLIIEQVSQLQFSNQTENQIAEFSVTLRGQRQDISGVNYYSPSQSVYKSPKF